MRALGRLRGALRSPELWRGLAVFGAVYGLEAVLRDVMGRLKAVEEVLAGGTVPRDDVVTLRELDELRGELAGHSHPAGSPGESAP